MEFFLTWIFPALVGIGIGLWLVRLREVKKEFLFVQDLESFKTQMRKGQLIDIRSDKAFALDKIKGARHFRPAVLKNKRQIKVRKDLPVYLYCQNGTRSRRLARRMTALGYREVHVLAGGFDAWKKS
jgi:rhodanese-related sulfurtransferase